MNDLLAPFFFVFLSQYARVHDIMALAELADVDDIQEPQFREIEADCFWCFSRLLDGLQDLYTKDRAGLYKMLSALESAIRANDPVLADWIQKEEIEYQEFAFRWMNCLLVREFPLVLVVRLWDSYLSNHSRIATTHVYVCAAVMAILSPKLRNLPHAEFVMMLQQNPPEQWTMSHIEMIVAQAYVYEKMQGQGKPSAGYKKA
jgi:hypothetical protein